MDILSVLDNIISKESLESIKTNVSKFYYDIENQFEKTVSYNLNGNSQSIKKELLIKELKQILDTQTIERTKYYLNRLLKSLSVQKEGKINDLNLNRWKEYEDIITDSLWIFDKRDTSGMHKADYWGNFIPQIPNQLLRRFTKQGEWVLDPFLGSGTTSLAAKNLGRSSIGYECNAEFREIIQEKVGCAQGDLFSPATTEFLAGKIVNNAEAANLREKLPYLFKDPIYLAVHEQKKKRRYGSVVSAEDRETAIAVAEEE